MRINDFKEMQQNLEQMRHNLEDIKKVDYIQPDLGKKRGKARRAVQKKISEIVHPKLTKIAKEEQIIVMVTILTVAVTFIFSTSIFAKTISEN